MHDLDMLHASRVGNSAPVLILKLVQVFLFIIGDILDGYE